MIRSLQLAADRAVSTESVVRESDRAAVEPWATLWQRWSSAASCAVI